MAPNVGDLVGVIRKYPTNRGNRSVDDWLSGKEADDGAEGLWRIHDDLYDLTTFITSHPGGRDWIQLTRGTDITEAFEVHHLRDNAEKLLPKFHVRSAAAPRNSLVTFKENGFYKTLKRKIQNQIPESGPTFETALITDFFAGATIAFAVMGAWWGYKWSMIAGLFLHMLVVASHNFLHMKDNWRMYYFNFSLMSYRDWRVSHVLSHHLFPNTIIDIEISMWEPLFHYLPDTKKSVIVRFLPWILCPLYFLLIFHVSLLQRVAEVVFSRKLGFRAEELACVTPLILVWLLGGVSIGHAFYTWNIVLFTGSFIFSIIGLTAAHHHPDIYHEGDAYTDDKDFGILQLASVRDRVEVTGSFFLVMISFGDHALHHLFPTIDHHHLPKLYPAFHETCKEFGVDHPLYPWAGLVTGMYKQLARNYQNGELNILNRKKNK